MENINSVIAGGGAAVLVAILSFIWQNNLFVRPEQLEKAKADILEKAETKYATIQMFRDFKESVSSDMAELKTNITELKKGVFDIYECIINKKC